MGKGLEWKEKKEWESPSKNSPGTSFSQKTQSLVTTRQNQNNQTKQKPDKNIFFSPHFIASYDLNFCFNVTKTF